MILAFFCEDVPYYIFRQQLLSSLLEFAVWVKR